MKNIGISFVCGMTVIVGAACGPQPDDSGEALAFSVIEEGEVEVHDGFGFDNGCYVGLVEMAYASRPIEDVFDEFIEGAAPPDVDYESEVTFVVFNDRCSSGGNSLLLNEARLEDGFLKLYLTLLLGSGPDSTYRQYSVVSFATVDIESPEGILVYLETEYGE